MKKQLLTFGITIILLTVGLSGCNKDISYSDEEKIIGTWNYNEPYEGKMITGSFTFFFNKTCIFTSSYAGGDIVQLNGIWNIIDDKLILNMEGVQNETDSFIFSNNDKTLILTDKNGYSRYLAKQ